MRWLLFTARITFICNLCYLASVAGRHFDLSRLHQSIVGTLVVMGAAAIFLNLFTNLSWLIAVVRNKLRENWVLALLNFLFLIFQIVNSLFILL